MKSYRLFVSSPGDVGEERQRAGDVVERLAAEFKGLVEIEPYFWEDNPMRVQADYQAQIPPTEGFNAVICILWSRLGTPLRPGPDGREWESGTEYEVVTAKEAARRQGTPDILLFRKTSGLAMTKMPTVEECERLGREVARLERFWAEHCVDESDGKIKGAYTQYGDAHEFEIKLTKHLRQLLLAFLGPAAQAGRRAKPVWQAGSPFRGLRVFDSEHAPVFCGRSAAVAEVLEAIRRRQVAGKGWLVVSGASGSGKSSLVRAGVLPKLTAPGVLEGYTAWRRALFLPGTRGDPFLPMALALLEQSALPELETTPEALAERLGSGSAAGVEIVAGALRQVASESRQVERHILESKACESLSRGQVAEAARYREVLVGLPYPRACIALVVDQLEEVFTQIECLEKRAAFLDLLAALAQSGQVMVLATMRADFWARLIEIPAVAALTQGDGRYDLVAPRPSELEEIITRPALAAGLAFEPGEEGGRSLDREILDEAVGTPDALPLLQFSLEALYQTRAADGTMTRQAWRDLGGLEGAIRHHAEAAFRQLPKATCDAAPDVFRRLVAARLASGGGLVFNRRWVPLGDFVSPAERAFVEAMISERLLVASTLSGGEAACALVHEALIVKWPELQRHLQNEEALHLLHSWMTPYFEHWRRSAPADRAQSLLPRGGQHLKSLESALATPGGASLFSKEEKEFIEASLRQPQSVTVYVRQGSEMAFKGAIPIVLVLGLLWYKNPTLLRDYVGKWLDPTYQTAAEKAYSENLSTLNTTLFDTSERLMLHQRALNETALGLQGLHAGGAGLGGLDSLKPPVPLSSRILSPNPSDASKLLFPLPGTNDPPAPATIPAPPDGQGTAAASTYPPDLLKALSATSRWRHLGGNSSLGLSKETTELLSPFLSPEVRESLLNLPPASPWTLPGPAAPAPQNETPAPPPAVP